MKRYAAAASALLFLCMLLGGCFAEPDSGAADEPEIVISGDAGDVASSEGSREEESAPVSDEAYFEGDCVSVLLEGTSAQASSDSVRIDGGRITITEEADYLISGRLEEGMIIVDADKDAKVRLILNGASVTSGSSAALYILGAENVELLLAEGSENTLANTGGFTAIDDSSIDGAVFSKQDLTLTGGGSLTVRSPFGHCIVCKDSLFVTGGTYVLECASHGLDVNDSISVEEGTVLQVDAGKDGIHCENGEDASLGTVLITGGTVDVEAQGDGISAGACLQIEGGTFGIMTGGGHENGEAHSSGGYGGFPGGGPGRHSFEAEAETAETEEDGSTSMKGLKAETTILLSGGNFSIDSADDCIHSNGFVTVDGGCFTLLSGDDAVRAEESLTVTEGSITVETCFEGLEAETIVIGGGTLDITAEDDGINASGGNDGSGYSGGRDGMFGGGMQHGGSSSGSIDISDGSIRIAAGGDGLDSNGTLTVSGGEILVFNPSPGDTSVIDSDRSPVITGGTFIGAGASTMMAQSFSGDSSQGVIACTTGSQKAGAEILVRNGDGEVLISCTAEYDAVLVIISSPAIEKGETYALTVGAASGSVTAQ